MLTFASLSRGEGGWEVKRLGRLLSSPPVSRLDYPSPSSFLFNYETEESLFKKKTYFIFFINDNVFF